MTNADYSMILLRDLFYRWYIPFFILSAIIFVPIIRYWIRKARHKVKHMPDEVIGALIVLVIAFLFICIPTERVLTDVKNESYYTCHGTIDKKLNRGGLYILMETDDGKAFSLDFTSACREKDVYEGPATVVYAKATGRILEFHPDE